MPPKKTKMPKIPPALMEQYLYLIGKTVRKRSKPTRKTATPRKARSDKGIKRKGVKRPRKR